MLVERMKVSALNCSRFSNDHCFFFNKVKFKGRKITNAALIANGYLKLRQPVPRTVHNCVKTEPKFSFIQF